MKLIQKIEYLQTHHFNEWLETRQEAENWLSGRQSMFCICGKLATGLHERSCRKFVNKVNSETVKRMAHYFSEQLAERGAG